MGNMLVKQGKIIDTGGAASVDGKANKVDLTALSTAGTTNTTGSTITAGTYFYLNGELVKAKTNIAANATYTLDTNYEKVTIGQELNTLNNAMRDVMYIELNLDYTNGNDSNDGLTQAKSVKTVSKLMELLDKYKKYITTIRVNIRNRIDLSENIYLQNVQYLDIHIYPNTVMNLSNDSTIYVRDNGVFNLYFEYAANSNITFNCNRHYVYMYCGRNGSGNIQAYTPSFVVNNPYTGSSYKAINFIGSDGYYTIHNHYTTISPYTDIAAEYGTVHVTGANNYEDTPSSTTFRAAYGLLILTGGPNYKNVSGQTIIEKGTIKAN